MTSSAVQETDVPYRRNAFRNSYISYRLVIRQDIGRVAAETSTSHGMIRKNYLSDFHVAPKQTARWSRRQHTSVTILS